MRTIFKLIYIAAFTLPLLAFAENPARGQAKAGGKAKALQQGQTITIFVDNAAKSACDIVINRFENKNEVEFRTEYARTEDLVQKIEKGASADILVAADLGQLKALRDKNLVLEEINLYSDQHSATPYPVLLLKPSENNQMAKKFHKSFNSGHADQAFRKNGFVSTFEKRRKQAAG